MGKIEKQDDAVLLAHALAYHLQKQGNRLAADIIRAAIPAIPGLTAEALEARMDSAPQPPAEAQAQGGGELSSILRTAAEYHYAQAACPRDQFGNTSNHRNLKLEAWHRQVADAITAITAPPSAPVGVEDHGVASPGEDDPKPPHTPALRWLADREAVATQEWQDGFNAAYSYYAQQPAAVDADAVMGVLCNKHAKFAEWWGELGERRSLLFMRALEAALAAQPGGGR